MLISFALILLLGMFGGWLCQKVKLPSLLGMLLVGILIGPYMLQWLDSRVLDISADIRRIALIIILMRAGLKLTVEDLKKVGRPAIMMCFIPATFELAGTMFFASQFLHMSLLDGAILGSVIAAVSPAVIVPKMIKLIDEGYGTDKAIPQMILAGASVDDVYVIVLFTTLTGLAQGKGIDIQSFINIPVSIIVGIIVGFIAGAMIYLFFKKVKISDIKKAFILLACCFVLVTIEDCFSQIISFASLLAIMALGLKIKQKDQHLAKQLSLCFDQLWIPAEIFLFVLVGASVSIHSALSVGLNAIALILCVLMVRMVGVWICLIATSLNVKERLFCLFAYTPKATVQAAIGGLPLAYGLACGQTVLAVSVIAILITAPLGAFLIDLTYKRFLKKSIRKPI